MRKLKILQLTNRLPYPLNDGGNIATYNVTKYLNKFGHQVTLVSLNTKKHFHDPSPLGQIATIHTTNIDTTITLTGIIKSFFKKTPYSVERFYSEDFKKQLIDILQKNEFDIVQVEGIYLAIYLKVIRQHSNAKVVLRSHNIEHQIWERVAKNEANPLKKIFLKDLYKKIKLFELKHLRKFDGIIAITENDEEFYRKAGFRHKLVTINAGVDLDLYQPSTTTPMKGSICFLGSLEWKPNLQGLMWFLEKVWPHLLEKKPELQFHVAGKNPPPFLNNLKIPGVTFHGMVPSAIDFVNKYQIVVVPLLSGGGMRLKIVEAMALGKCIVSTSIGAEGIDVQNGHNIILVNTPEDFISQILYLLENEQVLDKISQNACNHARIKYNWELLVKNFEAFYYELL
ncbi:MAG TPA: glycosyltransferase family 4 protein [Cytophagaceae bacterium]